MEGEFMKGRSYLKLTLFNRKENLKNTLLFILLLLWGVPSHATTNVGTAGAQFLKIGPGARVDSLGGAFGALANDVTSIYWNPAGISQLEKNQFFRHTYHLACRYPL